MITIQYDPATHCVVPLAWEPTIVQLSDALLMIEASEDRPESGMVHAFRLLLSKAPAASAQPVPYGLADLRAELETKAWEGPDASWMAAIICLNRRITDILCNRPSPVQPTPKSFADLTGTFADKSGTFAQPVPDTSGQAEIERDAARYRWLRTALFGEAIGVGEAYISMRVVGVCPTAVEIDAAIDAAMKGDQS